MPRGISSHMLRAALLFLALAVPADRAASAQDVAVVARVVDEVQRGPVSGAEASLLAADSSEISDATTGSDGFFTLAVPGAGEYLVRIELAGYETVTRAVAVEDGVLTAPAFVLTRTAIEIDGITVEVSPNPGRPSETESGRATQVLAGDRLAQMDRAGTSFIGAVRQLGGVQLRTVDYRGRSFTCIESGRRLSMFSNAEGTLAGCDPVAIVIDGRDSGIRGENALNFFRTLRLGDWESIQFLSSVEAGARFGLHASAQGALVLWRRGAGPHQSGARGGGGG